MISLASACELARDPLGVRRRVSPTGDGIHTQFMRLRRADVRVHRPCYKEFYMHKATPTSPPGWSPTAAGRPSRTLRPSPPPALSPCCAATQACTEGEPTPLQRAAGGEGEAAALIRRAAAAPWLPASHSLFPAAARARAALLVLSIYEIHERYQPPRLGRSHERHRGARL